MWMREKDENEEDDDDRRWWWLIRRTTTSLAVWEMSLGQMENMQLNISACHGFLFNCRCEDYTGYPASYQSMDQWSQRVLDWNQKYNLSMMGSTLTRCHFLNQQVWHPSKVAVSMNLIIKLAETWIFKSKFWRDQHFGFRSPIPSHLHWQIACPWRNKISFWPVAHVFGTPWTSQISCVAEIIQVLHGNPIFWCVKFHALEPDFFPNKGTHIIFSG
jgi:hypothetical protein